MNVSKFLNRKSVIYGILISLLITAALKTNLSVIYEEGSVINHFFFTMQLERATDILAAFGIFCLFIITRNTCRNMKRSYHIASLIVAFLFAIFVPLGRVFTSYEGFPVITHNAVQIIKTVIAVTGYTLLLYLFIILLFRLLESMKEHALIKSDDRGSFVVNFILRHRLIFFLILLAASSVIFVIIFPGYMMGDTKEHIREAFGIRLYSDSYYTYKYADSSLTNMRPVLSTLYIKGCMLLGNTIFGSYTAGLGIFVFSQMIAINAAVWRVCCILARNGIKGLYIILFLLYMALNPLTATLTYTMTKDTLFTAFLVLFITEFYSIITGSGKLLSYIVACAAALGAMAFRGDAVYDMAVVLIVYAVYAIITGKHKSLIITSTAFLAGMIIIHVIWSAAVLPAMHVSPGKKSVQASIPLQQTARYVLFHNDEVTDEERQSIDAIIDYDSIYTTYSPMYADNMIVATKNFTDEQFRDFLKTWIKLCAKDPGLALTAWLHNKFEYFYVQNTTFYYYYLELSNQTMEQTNEAGLESGIDFNLHYPASLLPLRELVDDIWQSEEAIPVWNLITLPALYMILLICVTIFFFIRKNAVGRIFMLFPWMLFILTNAFSATNAHYSRYMYSVVVAIPVVLLLSIKSGKRD